MAIGDRIKKLVEKKSDEKTTYVYGGFIIQKQGPIWRAFNDCGDPIGGQHTLDGARKVLLRQLNFDAYEEYPRIIKMIEKDME